MSEGERAIVPFFDTPTQIVLPFPSKEALERAQLEKYRLDYLLRFGEVPFEDVRRGAEPPDFLVMRDGSPYGVDCTALALEEKRLAEALFTRLIQKVAANDNASLEHLAGTHITIWFGHGTELPPRVSDHSTVEEIIETLEHVEVDRDRFARTATDLAAHGFPDTMPQTFPADLGVVEKESFSFQVAPTDSWQPRDQLSAQLGFNVLLSLPIMVEEARIRMELQRLVSDHDNGQTNQLLVVIGGPNRDGVCFPAEHALSLWLKEDAVKPVSAQHISQVTAHTWISGEIFDIPVQTNGAS